MTNDLLLPDSNEENLEFQLKTPNKSVANAKGGVLIIVRLFLALLGIIFIIIGIPIAILTPIPLVPIGLPIVILGVVLVARNSVAGRNWLKRTITKHPKLTRFAPSWLLNLILGETPSGDPNN